LDRKAAKRDFFEGAIAHRGKHNGQPANPDGEVCEAEKCCEKEGKKKGKQKRKLISSCEKKTNEMEKNLI